MTRPSSTRPICVQPAVCRRCGHVGVYVLGEYRHGDQACRPWWKPLLSHWLPLPPLTWDELERLRGKGSP